MATRANNKKIIEFRVEMLTKYTGENYATTYAAHYGGWELHVQKEKGGQTRGAFGFDYRKSTAEFMAYLEGCINGLYYAGIIK